METSFHSLHEECGVFGVFGVENAFETVLTGLSSLQHRGQEGCGVAFTEASGTLSVSKGPGLVSRVFPEGKRHGPSCRCAIGHVRYGTSGGRETENIQPFLFSRHGCRYALAHNGNFVNAEELKGMLGKSGALFLSSSDSEIAGHMIAAEGPGRKGIDEGSVRRALNRIEGAFSILVLTPDRLYACRDKNGFRPLSVGRLGKGFVVSSETCALRAAGAEFERDVLPGEVIEIGEDGLWSSFYSLDRRNAMCAMEYIYFARPDSDIEGINVHAFREESGKILFEESPVRADLVTGVPDSGLSAAIGFSKASGIPLETALVKNGYVGRTFIQPTQSLREAGVRMKLSAVRSVVQGKSVVVLDDSIVRGTTSRQIARMLREAGATGIHMRITSPPLRHPCFYGIDISSDTELISSRMGTEEVRRCIEVDSLAFLSEEGLLRAGRRTDLCMACFNASYPTALYSHDPENGKV